MTARTESIRRGFDSKVGTPDSCVTSILRLRVLRGIVGQRPMSSFSNKSAINCNSLKCCNIIVRLIKVTSPVECVSSCICVRVTLPVECVRRYICVYKYINDVVEIWPITVQAIFKLHAMLIMSSR